MLCLSRRVGEVIKIGNDISVQVLDIRGGIVRLGIVAPSGVAIDREEIRQRKQKEPRHGF
jgi:carbon storage regulator